MAEDDYKGRSGAASYAARRVSSPTGMDRPGGHPGRDTTSSGRDWDQESKDRESSGNNNSQNNNQTGQSGNNQGGQHKLKAALDRLAAEGKADTEQANVLKRYLSGVVSPHDKSDDKTPFHQKQTLYDDFLNEQIHKPIDFAGKFDKYDVNQPMAFGFGSVFGASSGELGKSSKAVTDSLKVMFDDFVGRGIPPQEAAQLTFNAMYPTVTMAGGHPGRDTKGIANLMGDPKIQYKKITQQLMGGYEGPTRYGLWGNYGGGGGWGSGWGGYGGGGGSGGGYGFSMQQDPMQQGYQRGQVGPGTLQEQVNQIYLGMGNLNAAPGFNKNRGGLISLLGLN